MNKITKRQHVVNREYLAKWADNNNQVYCLDNKGKLFPANPVRLCVHNYFYEIKSLNIVEKKLLLLMVGDEDNKLLVSNSNNCDTDKNIVKYFNELNSKKYRHPMLGIIDVLFFSAEVKPFLEKKKIIDPVLIKNIYKEGIEDFETFFERIGLFSLKKIFSCKFSNSVKDFSDLIYFISIQYSRTDVLKKRMIAKLNEFSVDINKIFPLIHICIAFKTANYLLNTELHISILYNNTKIPFITGNQPVINIKNLNTEEEAKELEFYYPISPTLSILISPKGINNKRLIHNRNVSIDEANYYNILIKKFSSKIFSNNKEILEIYKYLKR